MKTFVIIFVVLLTMVSCKNQKSPHEAIEKFNSLAIDFETSVRKAEMYLRLADKHCHQSGYTTFGDPDYLRTKKLFQKEAQEAEKRLLVCCELATVDAHFNYVYHAARYETVLSSGDFYFDHEKIIKTIFDNENFVPSPDWIDYAQKILGRKFYAIK